VPLANVPNSLQLLQRSTTSSSSLPLPLLPIASPSFVDDCQLALLEASRRAADAEESNINWSSTAVMNQSHFSNPPPPPPPPQLQPQPRMSRGTTTLAERWMSL
jgi:hypothetical protein